MMYHYSSPQDVEAEARHAVELCRAHGQPSSHATSLCVLALVLVERDPMESLLLLDEPSAIAALVRDRFLPLRIQLFRARVDIELATSPQVVGAEQNEHEAVAFICGHAA